MKRLKQCNGNSMKGDELTFSKMELVNTNVKINFFLFGSQIIWFCQMCSSYVDFRVLDTLYF